MLSFCYFNGKYITFKVGYYFSYLNFQTRLADYEGIPLDKGDNWGKLPKIDNEFKNTINIGELGKRATYKYHIFIMAKTRLMLSISILSIIISFVSCYELNYRNNQLEKLAEDPNTNQRCAEEISALDGLSYLKMIDASTKIPNGILEGNLFDLGSFDECYNIKSEKQNASGYIYGKYCLNTINQNIFNVSEQKLWNNFKRPFPIHPGGVGIDPRVLGVDQGSVGLHWAVCLPSGCTAEDYIGLGTIDENYCYSKDTKQELDVGAWVTIGIFIFIAVLVISSTIYDTYLLYAEKKPRTELFIAFSGLTNGRKIFQSSTNPDQLLCLNGIRAISMMWVILGHEYSSAMSAPINNAVDLLNFQTHAANMFLSSAPLSVDTFFFAGGLVTVYTYLKATIDKKIKFDIVMYYVHRVLRLTPALGAAILIYAFLGRFLGDGPLWANVDVVLGAPCRENWWTTLLYIQNYYPTDAMNTCVPQTWYLAVDMQLFLLSPLILIPLVILPVYTLIGLVVLFILGMIIPFVLGYVYELSPFMIDLEKDPMDMMRYYYGKTYARFAPYVLGMLVGYFIYQIKSGIRKVNLKPIQVCLAWIVGVGILVVCVYAPFDLMQMDYDRVAYSTFFAYHRQLWSIGLAIVVLLCVSGYGGPIDQFLSLPVFQILTKVSYAMYLVHYILILIRYSQTRTQMVFGNLEIMRDFWGDFAFSAGAGLVFCICFESPIIILEKLIFKTSVKQSDKIQQSTPTS